MFEGQANVEGVFSLRAMGRLWLGAGCLGEGARGGMGCGVNHDWCYWPQNPGIYLMGKKVFLLFSVTIFRKTLSDSGALFPGLYQALHTTVRESITSACRKEL